MLVNRSGGLWRTLLKRVRRAIKRVREAVEWAGPSRQQRGVAPRALACLVVAGAICQAQEGGTASPAARPNVLFIAVDDLKPVLGCYGDKVARTPNIDKLAAGGRVFEKAYCQFAVCSPSRVSLLTGLRPDATQVQDLKTFFRDKTPNVITLPQHFGSSGYATAGFGKIYHGWHPTKQDVPRSWTDGWKNTTVTKRYFEPGKSEKEDQLAASGKDPLDIRVSLTDRGAVEDDECQDGQLTKMALHQLEDYARQYKETGKPFFLAVGYYKPHLPFNAPEKYWALYDKVDFGFENYKGTRKHPAGAPPYVAPWFPGEPGHYDDFPKGGIKDPAQARQLVHAYYACVSFIDAQIGRLLDELEKLGLAGNTIVVLWGDHGWHLGDHDGYWAKHTNFEQATHAPLIIQFPGDALAGKPVRNVVEFVDIYPTLCDLAGLPAPKQPAGLELQGRSLKPILEDPAAPWDDAAFSQYNRKQSLMGYTVRTPRYRYTAWIDKAAPGAPPDAEELYDYEVDPRETKSLASDPKYQETLESLRKKLDGGQGWKHTARP